MVLRECACFAGLEKLRSVKVAEEFDQLRDDTGPTRLMTSSKARPTMRETLLWRERNTSPPYSTSFLRSDYMAVTGYASATKTSCASLRTSEVTGFAVRSP
jgi:hypothetical protein